MRARRADADDHVAGPLLVQLGQHAVALDRADREAGQIVFAVAVHARHLGGLAAHQGRARQLAAVGDAGDHALGDLQVQLAGGEVVEEQQRLGALGQQVVDAHGHQVDADRGVHLGVDGDAQLGADAVGGGDQQRVVVACRLQVEQGAETTQAAVRAGAPGGLGQRLDGLDQGGARIDIDAGLGVGKAVLGVAHAFALARRRPNGPFLKGNLPHTSSLCLQTRGCARLLAADDDDHHYR